MPLLFWYPIIIWSGLYGLAFETLPARKNNNRAEGSKEYRGTR
jgi:hypothetical protein